MPARLEKETPVELLYRDLHSAFQKEKTRETDGRGSRCNSTNEISREQMKIPLRFSLKLPQPSLPTYRKVSCCLFVFLSLPVFRVGRNESFHIVRFFLWCQDQAVSSPNRHPSSSEIHTPMYTTSWGEWDVNAAAKMAFVATVFVVVGVAQAGKVIREAARWRSNTVVLGRWRHERWWWSFVLESGRVERRRAEDVHWTWVLSGVCCWLPAAQMCGRWTGE
jgi:hypothetical protein